jgi:hypothetical protein
MATPEYFAANLLYQLGKLARRWLSHLLFVNIVRKYECWTVREMSMLAASQQAEGAGTNHPLALRMAVIAFLTNNIAIGTLWGSFSVLGRTVSYWMLAALSARRRRPALATA